MALVRKRDNEIAAPKWIGDFLSREHLMPFPARVDPDQFDDTLGAKVTAGADAAGGVNEIQRVTVTGGPTGGTFTLSLDEDETDPIAHDATAEVVEAALEALDSIGVGNVSVTGPAGGPYTVTFQNTLGNQDVDELTADGSSLTGGSNPDVDVDTDREGAAGAVAITVTALTRAIPFGTVLRFGSGKYAKLTSSAAKGATTLAVEPLVSGVSEGDVAIFSPTGRKTIKSGTPVGRTFAERDSSTPFGPASGSDDEVYLVAFDIEDAVSDPDATFYRPGSLVKENYLPDIDTMDGSVRSKIRELYQCIVGKD